MKIELTKIEFELVKKLGFRIIRIRNGVQLQFFNDDLDTILSVRPCWQEDLDMWNLLVELQERS